MRLNFIRQFKAYSLDHKIELAASVFIVAVIIGFHATILHYGGSLWRDEINSVHLSSEPLATGIHQDLLYDSFPPFSILVFHSWSLFTQTDQGFRVLGFLIGMGVLLAFWLNSRWLNLGAPLLALAVFEFNYVAIRFGDSMRPYGLGIVFIILTVGLVWKLVTSSQFNWKLFDWAALTAVISVQAMYQNAFLLLGICSGAVVVALMQKNWRKVIWVLSVGGVAALSLVPYIGFVKHANDWSDVAKYIYDPDAIWTIIGNALSPMGTALILLLVAIIFGGAWVVCLSPNRHKLSNEKRELFYFSFFTLVVGGVGFLVFLQRMRVPTQTWYFIPLLAIVGICLDSIFCVLISNLRTQRIIKICVALLLLVLVLPSNLVRLKNRTTNIDIVAATLPVLTARADLILINPWQIGVSFNRYYHGQTPWLTLPPLDDSSIFRYDVIKQKLAEPDPTNAAFVAMKNTLKSGNQVWVVGSTHSNTIQKPTGTFMNPYIEYWTWTLEQFMSQHTNQKKNVEIRVDRPVSEYENFPVTVFQGWKE